MQTKKKKNLKKFHFDLKFRYFHLNIGNCVFCCEQRKKYLKLNKISKINEKYVYTAAHIIFGMFVKYFWL